MTDRHMRPGASCTYLQAGVSIADGDEAARGFLPHATTTERPGSLGQLGGFGGLFDLKKTGLRDPILVAGTDGVGTKLLLAIQTGHHLELGTDLVAMCVNDVLAQGAEPLFFLDYYAAGRLQPDRNDALAKGIAAGCRLAGCALIGGETAEMPGLYHHDHYDLAGFAVGGVERTRLLPNHAAMQAGDIVIALASSGLHANGFSLVRMVLERSGADLDAPAPFDESRALGRALLTPTRIYVRPLLPLLHDGLIKALAHITGGGIAANCARMCPDGLVVHIDDDALDIPPVFQWIAETGPVDPQEMRAVFNLGVGMIAVVAKNDAHIVIDRLSASGQTCFAAGTLLAAE